MSSTLLKSRSSLRSLRLFSTSSTQNIRKIIVKEEGKIITIEGKPEESPRTKNLIDPNLFASANSCETYKNCHPLCKFDKIHEIKHTDVLILDQFTDSNGDIIPRDITNLCERQHYRMDKLIGMAQKAGLMGSKDK